MIGNRWFECCGMDPIQDAQILTDYLEYRKQKENNSFNYLMYADNIWMLDQLHCRNFPLDLRFHQRVIHQQHKERNSSMKS
jgi:hypothetical protein